jgi:folylpolyglutamate synthase/dihydropteroate synthase
VEDAVGLAQAEASKDDLILVTGSLYVVGAARAALGLH